MALRRSCRSIKANNCNVYNNLSLSDVLCPICRGILVEPVTLPCSHGFCLSCFERTIANASLACPLCRKRISSWHRVAKRENKIVNVDLWQAIKTLFPQQLENKLNDREENLLEESPRRLATPGEIRREYEEQALKEKLALQKEREAEERASEELIQKILGEDKLRLNEQVAIQLSNEINSKGKMSGSVKGTGAFKKCKPLNKFLSNVKNQGSKASLRPIKKSNSAKTKKKTFVKKVVCQDKKSKCLKTTHSSASNLAHSSLRKESVTVEVSDSNDSIENECHYFKPIDLKNIPPSELSTVVKVPAKIQCASTVIIGAPTGENNFTHDDSMSAFARFEMVWLEIPQKQKQTVLSPPTKRMPGRKRKLANDAFEIQNANVLDCVTNIPDPLEPDIADLMQSPNSQKNNMISSPEKESEENQTAKSSLDNSRNTRMNSVNESPPFQGFQLTTKKKITQESSSKPVENSSLATDTSRTREEQEKQDFALAKKLHKHLNNVYYPTRSRSSITLRSRKNCRQVTLDEIIRSRVK